MQERSLKTERERKREEKEKEREGQRGKVIDSKGKNFILSKRTIISVFSECNTKSIR